jgi:transposase InsO family protein
MVRFEKSTSSHLRANNSLRRSPVVTSSITIKRKHESNCSETLFGSLKVERLHGQHFETRRQGKDEALDWLHWYNQTRLHSTLKYVSPMQFEQDSAFSAETSAN